MSNETVTKSGRFYCVSLTPDICKTPVGASTPPVPYNVVGEFSEAKDVSPNVKSHSEPVILHERSTIPTVKGDEPGTAGGIKSGTVGKQVETKTASAIHRANGANKVQVGREVWMNARNTVGKIYERGGQAARAAFTPIADSILSALESPREALKGVAQAYKDDVSAAAHDAGDRLMETGGKVAAGGTAVAVAGVALDATVVGAPVGVAMNAAGGAVAGVGAAATTAGAAISGGAHVLDQTAEYVLTGKTPEFVNAAVTTGINLVEGLALRKLGPVGNWLGGKLKALGKPAKLKPKPGSATARPAAPKQPKASDDGKSRQTKREKSDAPSSCCPRDKGPAGKPVMGRKPVHFGTGQEILQQTDFVLNAAIPIEWTRCYRSSAETEDWGLFGARWSSPYTTYLSVTEYGIVYHDESGRALRLPLLAEGHVHDNVKEGFSLIRSAVDEFVLTWRDGARDTFVRNGDALLPHGYDGVNPMLRPAPPLRAERFSLARKAGRDDRGLTIERIQHAAPDEAILRVRTDDGRVLEAIRDAPLPEERQAQAASAGRIARVEEILDDGTRICHVRYRYEIAAAMEPDIATGAEQAGETYRRCRFDLTEDTNLAGDSRRYTYQHHLLISYTDYIGFAQYLHWISLDALRACWAGSALTSTQIVDRFPITLKNSYQARVTRIWSSADDDVVTIEYIDDETSRVTEHGGVLEYKFDSNWLAVEVRRGEGAAAILLGHREWDLNGMLVAETDGAGHTTRYEYDSIGNLTLTTDPGGYRTRIEYDQAGLPTAIIDGLGHTTRYSYDDNGRLTTSADALGYVTHFRYDHRGWLTEVVDAKGSTRTFSYDRLGRLLHETDCSGYATSYLYDQRGFLVEVKDALGHLTRYGRDDIGRVVKITLPDKSQVSVEYDANSNVLAAVDEMGNVTRYRRNARGLVVEQVDSLGRSVHYVYNSAMAVVELVNACGTSYHLGYNQEGWLISETDFDGRTKKYRYDDSGWLVETDSCGSIVHLVRDSRGLLIGKITEDAVLRFSYDATGRMVAATGPNSEHIFGYDACGNLINECASYYLRGGNYDHADPGIPRASDFSFETHFEYDELGNRTTVTLPSGERIDILRYGSGHWHGMCWNGVSLADIERDGLHRERARQLGTQRNRLSFIRDYDARSKITKLILGGERSSRPIRERAFTYDLTGNLVTVHESAHNGSATDIEYKYNAMGQLVRSKQGDEVEAFSFDTSDNMFAHVAPASDSARSEMGPLKGNWRRASGNILRRHGSSSYLYDQKGNVVRKHRSEKRSEYCPDIVFAYDAESRVEHLHRKCGDVESSARYYYDPFGRRFAKKVGLSHASEAAKSGKSATVHSVARTTVFVWDGDLLLQEVDARRIVTYLYEPDSFVPLARVEAAGEHRNSNIFELLLRADEKRKTAELIAPKANSSSCGKSAAVSNDSALSSQQIQIGYYSCDNIGTPRELVDERGNITWSVQRKAWGRISKIRDATVDQPLRFQGQYEDSESGLVYNRYRYYDPDTARYLTPDPIGLLGGLNAYSYAPNPTGWIDPRGLARGRGGCDPCCGSNPAAEAMATQGVTALNPGNPYTGKDVYTNMVLRKGTILYSLAPGRPPGFAVTNHTLMKAGGSAQAYHDLTQVQSKNLPPGLSMRTKVTAYRVTQDICVAKGKALNNPQFGGGGATQYFVSPTDLGKLRAGSTRAI